MRPIPNTSEVLEDLRKEWRQADQQSRKEIEDIAEKVKLIDWVMKK